jgi:short-chain fatty acids transporter
MAFPSKKTLHLSFPSPFEIALLLTAVSFIASVWMTGPPDMGVAAYSWEVLQFWKKGFWELLEFTLQMVLILIFGHALAISPVVDRFLTRLAARADSNTKGVLLTAMTTLIAGYINWGFGLILGAVLARKIGESAKANQMDLNYPLVAAAGYVGMLVWHGGFSGSAPLKVAEADHFLVREIGVIPIDQTILSPSNVLINGVLVICIMATFYLLSKTKYKPSICPEETMGEKQVKGHKNYIGLLIGTIIMALCIYDFYRVSDYGWGFINLNFVNFLLFGLGLCLHVDLQDYVRAVEKALQGATGIILQFPFYAGILGILKYSGLLMVIAAYFVEQSSSSTFPLLTFFSAALINLFVPSGGGQWAVQGPVIIEAAKEMGLDIPKIIMALAYGDQLSNMLQPFWALPLLAITGVSAKQLLKYTLIIFVVAALVLGIGIYIST